MTNKGLGKGRRRKLKEGVKVPNHMRNSFGGTAESGLVRILLALRDRRLNANGLRRASFAAQTRPLPTHLL